MAQFRAVSFDLDGTLWRQAECHTHGLQIVLPKLMSHLPEEDPDRLVSLFNAVFLDLVKKYGLGDRRAASRARRFAKLLDVYGIKDRNLVQELSSTYYSACRLSMRSYLRRGATRLIKKLKNKGLSVGIISDGSPAVQHQTIRGLGLSSCMDFVVISGTEGYNKPHEGLFDRAVELAGVTPECMLHVGKSPMTDVLGARRAGISAAWLQTASRTRPAGYPEPDYAIQQLSEVLPLLEED